MGGATHAFLRTADGQIQTVDVPGSTKTQAENINARGDMTGEYDDSAVANQGFVRTADGTFAAFGCRAYCASCHMFGFELALTALRTSETLLLR
jgi:hypothetical protein